MAANIDRSQYWKLRKIYHVLKDGSLGEQINVFLFLVIKVKPFYISLSMLVQFLKT